MLLISTLFFLLSLGIVYWTHSRYHMGLVLQPHTGSDLEEAPELPLISVIVPARNEARNIRRCVEALLRQTYPQFELIVVDDHSTDATPDIVTEIAAAEGAGTLHLLRAPVRPPGWAGKPHALWAGVQAARGSWLCFIDADTFAQPDLLKAAYASSQRWRADLLTILTEQELGSFWERVILPLVFTALSVGFSAARVNDPQAPEAIANGQFILIRRDVYFQTGGHEAVRGEIAEDKALAERVKRAGFRLVLADGRVYARTRMYTRLDEIWEGWTKNIYLGMRDRLGLLFVGGVVSLAGALALPLWLAGSLVWWAGQGGWQAGVSVIQALTIWVWLLVQRARAARAFHISPLYAITFPLGALVFTAMIFTSVFNVVSGRGVTWKGRSYI
jgi:chlorobactene glucosyltransferase